MRRVAEIAAAVMLAALLASCGGGGKGLATGEPQSVVTHKVVPGESWESISEEYYGSAGRAGALAGFNGADPSEPPRAGTGIRIPLSAGDLDTIDARLDASAVYNEGLDLAMSGDYAGAVEKFKRALSRDPGLNEASFNLAVTYQKLGLYAKAESVLEELVADEPGVADYYFALGNSRFHLGDYGGAARAFRWALDADPGHLEALYSLAVSQEKMGRPSDARETWRRYLELDPSSEWADEARKRLSTLEKGPG